MTPAGTTPGPPPAGPALADLAGQLAATALANVTREFPYAPAHVVAGPDDVALPRRHHPSFYGAYDWHSAVHMHWLLVRLLRRCPDRVDEAAVRRVLDAHLAPERLRSEADYLRAHPSFERPYGWAWLLALAAECSGAEAQAQGADKRWAQALRPAVDAVAALVLDWLARAGTPVRDGAHGNTAFALGLLLDAAGPLELPASAAAVRHRAGGWYLGDRNAPATWEPSGQDFLSPALCEADLVRRLLPAPELATWLTAFLPGLAQGRPRSLLEPVGVPDRSDGLLGHLDGLSLSRSAALRALGAALPAEDPRRPVLLHAAARTLAVGLAALDEEGYLSSHWLASFAALALG